MLGFIMQFNSFQLHAVKYKRLKAELLFFDTCSMNIDLKFSINTNMAIKFAYIYFNLIGYRSRRRLIILKAARLL
jgi:hypothetical protein